jgi:hypothetical protein
MKTAQEQFNILEKYGFNLARMIAGSKSSYWGKYPDHLIYFNANIITKSHGKIWHGDLNLTLDGDKLKIVAEEIGEPIYVLYEMDARFGEENLPTDKLIKRAKWSTLQLP